MTACESQMRDDEECHHTGEKKRGGGERLERRGEVLP